MFLYVRLLIYCSFLCLLSACTSKSDIKKLIPLHNTEEFESFVVDTTTNLKIINISESSVDTLLGNYDTLLYKIQKYHKDTIIVAKFHIDKREFIKGYKIMSLPTTFLILGDSLKAVFQGPLERYELEFVIKKFLK